MMKSSVVSNLSFATEDWQAERLNMQAEQLNLLTALQLALVNNPQTKAAREDWKTKASRYRLPDLDAQ